MLLCSARKTVTATSTSTSTTEPVAGPSGVQSKKRKLEKESTPPVEGGDVTQKQKKKKKKKLDVGAGGEPSTLTQFAQPAESQVEEAVSFIIVKIFTWCLITMCVCVCV